MPAYNVDFSYEIEAFGSTVINADNEEQAAEFAEDFIVDTYPEAINYVVDDVKEIAVVKEVN